MAHILVCPEPQFLFADKTKGVFLLAQETPVRFHFRLFDTEPMKGLDRANAASQVFNPMVMLVWNGVFTDQISFIRLTITATTTNAARATSLAVSRASRSVAR